MVINDEGLLLAIIIVNFRTPDNTIDSIKSLLPEIKNISAQVIIVDNNSNDGSSEEIKNWIIANEEEAQIHLLQSKHNLGFGYGNNIGIKAVKAEYYLLLNSDTIVKPGALTHLLKTMEIETSSGIASPRLEWPNGDGQESCFNFPRPLSELILSAQTGIIDQILKKYIIAFPVQAQKFYPQWTSFACVLVRKEVLDSVGLLDEGYFMYFEDIEFCHRVKNAGWNIVHTPQARVIHLRGGSSPVKSLAQQKKRLPPYYYESRTRYFYQSYGRIGLLLANIFWVVGRFISFCRQLLGRSDKTVNKGQWYDIWRNFIKPLSSYTHPEKTK